MVVVLILSQVELLNQLSLTSANGAKFQFQIVIWYTMYQRQLPTVPGLKRIVSASLLLASALTLDVFLEFIITTAVAFPRKMGYSGLCAALMDKRVPLSIFPTTNTTLKSLISVSPGFSNNAETWGVWLLLFRVNVATKI